MAYLQFVNFLDVQLYHLSIFWHLFQNENDLLHLGSFPMHTQAWLTQSHPDQILDESLTYFTEVKWKQNKCSECYMEKNYID